MPPNNTSPLNGLVLLGGQSARMGTPKALLNYHGVFQGDYCRMLLGPHCQQVYVSCRTEQLDLPEFNQAFSSAPKILDQYASIGPLTGVLSAMQADPLSAWLVLACDMPLVDSNVIERLVLARNPHRLATLFGHAASGPEPLLLEPLCAIYEPACLPRFLQAYRQGQTGLQGILRSVCAEDQLEMLEAPSAQANGESLLRSVNTAREYRRWHEP